MDCMQKWKVLLICMVLIQTHVQAKKQKSSVITGISDIKEFKKLLRTKTNVLVLFINDLKATGPVSDIFKSTADIMKGQATLAIIDCNNQDGKKLCKKVKIGTEKAYFIKHYKDGEFHKDYERSASINSITNFLRDPTGDLPWEEDPTATDIFHLQDGDALAKFLKKSAAAFKKSMIMFYAPWCGYCKVLKPEYVKASAVLKGEALLAAIDVSKPGNSKVRQMYNITGFPTLLYYEKGQYKLPYNGDNKYQALVDFIRDPNEAMYKKKAEILDVTWTDLKNVATLTLDDFESTLEKFEHGLVAFYAPWCGHCKNFKPEFEAAGLEIKNLKIDGMLGAVDATAERDLAVRFIVQSYPILKYFNRGQYQYDVGIFKKKEEVINFMKDPKKPEPPSLTEPPWAEEESAVRHLNLSSFKNTLRKVKYALVMFYAPWCRHCRSIKPEFVKAADRFADELRVLFGAVDCTVEKELCENHDVTAYPTITYYSYLDKATTSYTGPRKEKNFVDFIENRMGSYFTNAKNTGAWVSSTGYGENVQIATDDDFESIISETNPTFVMFYASWCAHCVAAKPAFTRLATVIKGRNSGLKIVAVDAAKHAKVADIAGIESLPTFKMFASGKVIADYNGNRSYDDMLKFCDKYVKVKDEL